jgi:F-type H+-transporting ATPase subunit epsilon
MPFELIVVTPEGQAFRERVEGVVLPGTEGEFGVLPGHEPFLTGLRIGEMRIQKQDETLEATISDGFAEVHADRVSVLVGSCEFAHERGLARAAIARERARRQLDEMRGTAEGEEVYQQYQGAYSEAISRTSGSSDRFKH